jgi:hypothetical protein
VNAPLSRAVADRVAELDRKTDREALLALRVLVGDMARLSKQAEQIAHAVPTCGVDTLALGAIRTQVGMAWWSLDLAEAQLPGEGK